MKYNSFPLGQIPKELQRPEIEQLKKAGYKLKDARDAVEIFEGKVAKFTGAKYAIAVDCCSHGLFLCLKYYKLIKYSPKITIPRQTYVSVPMQIIHAGFKVVFKHIKWHGIYRLEPANIWDAAVRWINGMYIPGSLMVLSFQIKKRIPIGRGGMILTDNKFIYNKLKLMRYDGRDLTTPYDSENHIKCLGYHFYMTPEDAARGILLMDAIKEEGDFGCYENYPNIEKML